MFSEEELIPVNEARNDDRTNVIHIKNSASRTKDDLEPRCNGIDESKPSLDAVDRISRSSSSSSLTNVDITFEPNIDMMVNDFDDEQTLNEEEALANLEDSHDEIATLKEESEMPLEELLAKYKLKHETSKANVKNFESDLKNGNEEEEDVDRAESYVKKSIMIGDAYQAIIPAGLSQYGDVLPYENEDKLIWEPSQVSEQEVEEYLLKTGDIKPSASGEEVILNDDENHQQSSRNTHSNKSNPPECALSSVEIEHKMINKHIRTDSELNGIVKDNEQALHLLVQCGYDFKEALRRKRLNAVPLTGSISLWSEEECKNFEDGIQMFGKDFIKIRQHQVRTRSMRELVHFYYLWKKSERRDHELANSDTVDHMDIYLNETGDFSSTNMSATPDGTPISPQFSKKHILFAQNNFSIMTGNTAAVKTNTYRKRRTPVELLTN